MSNQSKFIAFKSSLILGRDDKNLRKKLNKSQIDKALKEVEVELRNKKFKIKDF